MKRYLNIGISIAALLLSLLIIITACNTDGSISSADSGQTVPSTVTTTALSSDPDSTTKAPITTDGQPSTPPSTTLSIPVTSVPGSSAVSDRPAATPLPTQTTEPATLPATEPVTKPTTEPVTEPETAEPAPANPYAELSRNAKYVLLYDITDGKILYSTGADQQIYPASTTKLLTLLYALTIVDEETVFTVGKEINMAPWDSSKANIRVGEQYTCTDMVAALLLPSGNDAAYTIAVTCGRILADDPSLSASTALARFMSGLNEYASTLGLSGTHFVTPDGYHDADHVTTVGDMMQIALLAKAHPLLSHIMATSSYKVTDLANGRTQTWKNSNNLIQPGSSYYYAYANGCKTGYHTPAGYCLIATAEKDGRELMVLIYKCSNKNARFTDAKNFLELGFAQLAS